MKAFLGLFLTTLSLCVTCGADAERRQSENDIKAAVFRYQFVHLTPEQQAVNAKFYVLSYGQKARLQPDKEFLKRFATNSPPVKDGYLVIGDSAGWTAKGTGGRGLLFTVYPVTRISETEVTVLSMWQATASPGSSQKYHLKKENGAWTILDNQ